MPGPGGVRAQFAPVCPRMAGGERERERERESFIIMEKKRRRDEESGYTEFGCIGFRV